MALIVTNKNMKKNHKTQIIQLQSGPKN